MSKTLEEYVNDGYVVVPARVIVGAGIFATDKGRYPILQCARVFRNERDELEVWSSDSFRAVRIFWPDTVNGDNKYDVRVNLSALKKTKIIPTKPKLDQYVALMSGDLATSVKLLNQAVGKHYDEGGSALVTNVDGNFPDMRKLWKNDWKASRIKELPQMNIQFVSDMLKASDVLFSTPKHVVTCEFFPGENSYEPVCFIARALKSKAYEFDKRLNKAYAEMLIMPIRK